MIKQFKDLNEKLSEWIKRISYKPGYELSFGTMPGDEHITFTVSYTAVDSTNFNKKIDLQFTSLVSSYFLHTLDFDHFKREIKKIYKKLENHEFDEFFKVDGVVEVNPHINTWEQL